MTRSDGTDNRIRKLLRGLSRAKAPGDFQAKLAARIARDTARGRSRFTLVRRFAIPGLGLLLVGALSFLVYTTQFRFDGVEQLRPADERTAPTIPGSPPESQPGVMKGGDADRIQHSPPGRSIPADPDRNRITDRADGEASDSKMESPALSRPDPTPVTISAGEEKAVTRPALRGKSVPGRALIPEAALPDSAGRADSLAVGDTLGVDTARGDGNRLRDSLRNPGPD